MPGVRALFPLDGSEPTFRAVERGLAMLARIKDAHATFLVVLNKNLRDMPADAAEYLTYDDEDEIFIRDDEAQAVLDKATAIAKKLKFTRTEAKTVTGKPYEAILSEAKKCEVLVMHRLDREEAEEKRRGGVLEKLCREAPCNVWLVQTE